MISFITTEEAKTGFVPKRKKRQARINSLVRTISIVNQKLRIMPVQSYGILTGAK